jgi:YD repeat-containing protein
MRTFRRRLSFILLVVTLFSLFPRAEVSAMARPRVQSRTEAHLVPLGAAPVPTRPTAAVSATAPAAVPLASPTALKRVLFYGPTSSGGVATSFSWLTPTILNEEQWGEQTESYFRQFDAIVISNYDSATQGCHETTTVLAAALETKQKWSSVVSGNIVVTSSDLEFHALHSINPQNQGLALQLLNQSLKFAAAGSSAGPGLYIDYSCYVPDTTAVPVNLLSHFGTFMAFWSERDTVHRRQNHPILENLTDANLSTWWWSAHAAFSQYPSTFTALAYADPIAGTADPEVGQPSAAISPHILVRGNERDPIAPLPDDYGVGDCDCLKSGDPTPLYGDPVDPRTLSYVRTATDLTVPSVGPPLTFTRTYVSLFADPTKYPVGSLGPGWRHIYEEQLTLAGTVGGEPNTIIFEDALGSRLRFMTTGTTTETGPGGVTRTVYPATRGIYAKLTKDAGSTQYVLTDRAGAIQIFNATGKLVERRDPQGRRQTLTYFNTPGQFQHGQLQEVKDVLTARTLTFTYQQGTLPNGQLAPVRLLTVRNQLNQGVGFGYAAQGGVQTPLSRVDANGVITRYGYTDLSSGALTNLMSEVYQGAFTLDADVSNIYVNGRISMQADARGMLTTYAQTATADQTITTITTSNDTGSEVYDTFQYVYRADGTLALIMQDTLPQAQIAVDEKTLVPTQLFDANGAMTAMTINPVGQPTKIVDANGATTAITYNSQNLPTIIVGSDGVTTEITYDTATNRKPMTVVRKATANPVDALTTTYTYTPYVAPDPRADQVETVRGPDNVVTKYTYDSLGQVTDVTTGFGTPGLATTVHTVYDVLGRPTHVTEAYGTPLATTTLTVYNPNHQVTKVTRNYQGTGQYTAQYPDRNVWTEYGYDSLARPIWTKAVDGHYSSYTAYTSQGAIAWTMQNPVNSSGVPTLPTGTSPPAFSPARPDANVATLYQYNQQGLVTLSTQTPPASSAARPRLRPASSTMASTVPSRRRSTIAPTKA